MAAKKKKKSGSTGAGQELGFIVDGIAAVFGWVGATVLGIGSFLRWAGTTTWEVLSGERARQPLGMFLAAVSVFVFVAMLDYQAGLPNENACGTIGFSMAEFLLVRFGAGAFLAPLFGVFWGITRLVREGPSRAITKFIGVAGLTLTSSVTAFGLTPGREPDTSFPRGLGGTYGESLYEPLVGSLGGFGLAVLVALFGAISMLLATEWAFVPLIRELAARGRAAVFQPAPSSKHERRAAKAAPENREGLIKRMWSGFIGAFRPFHTEEEGGVAAKSKAKPIPVRVHGREGGEEEADEYEEGEYDEGEEYDEDEEYEDDEEYDDEEYDEDEEYEDDDEYEDEEEEDEEEVLEPKPLGPIPRIAAGPDGGFGNGKKPPARKVVKQPRLDSLPDPKILKGEAKPNRSKVQSEIDALGQRLQAVFDAFGLNAKVVGAERGPTLTLFEVQLATGVSVKKLKNQRDDLGVALGSHGVRIVYPLPGRSTVGIEVPNLKREMVRLKDVFDEVETNWENIKLPVLLGRDTLGKPAFEDLTDMPHMLIAGTTGSGKSVALNSILASWLLTRTPDQLRLVLIDPKQVELQLYRDIPHLLCPVVTDMKRAPFTLEWATRQMEDRLHMFKLAGVRNISDYNGLGNSELKKRLGEETYDPDEYPDTLPFIVLVIDELADMMLVSAKEVEVAVSRLAAKARAAGIHLVVATQRPSTDVVTGLIKMNLPVRIAFKVTSAVDSRVILDESGADDLLGNGDFLYRPPGAAGMVRGQGAFLSEDEVRQICDHLRKHGKPEFLEDLVQMKGPAAGGEVDDPLFDDAVRIILQSGRGSASLLQRALSIGYTRASRLIDIMTEQGVVGPHTGSKAREILLTLEEWEASQKQPS